MLVEGPRWLGTVWLFALGSRATFTTVPGRIATDARRHRGRPSCWVSPRHSIFAHYAADPPPFGGLAMRPSPRRCIRRWCTRRLSLPTPLPPFSDFAERYTRHRAWPHRRTTSSLPEMIKFATMYAELWTWQAKEMYSYERSKGPLRVLHIAYIESITISSIRYSWNHEDQIRNIVKLCIVCNIIIGFLFINIAVDFQ